MMKNVWIPVAVVILIVIGAVFLQKQQAPNSKKEVMLPSPTVASGLPETAQQISVIAKEFMFNQKTITVSSGKKVKLTFDNVGAMPHNFIIDELGVRTKTVKPGTSETIEFTPLKKGRFVFYCGIGNHRQMGMQGTIEVK